MWLLGSCLVPIDSVDLEKTKACSLLTSVRGLGYRGVPPYLWSSDHRFLE